MPKPSVVGKAMLGPVVVFGLSCAVFWESAQLIKLPPAWFTFEFLQYAEIGKNLATEGTFDTRLVEPMALAYLDEHHHGPPDKRWPVINRYPFPCVVIALLMTMLGPNERAAAWSNGLAASGLAALAFALAYRWYGARWAVLVALLILLNPSFYGSFVLLGTPDIWFALAFALELLAWCRLTDEPGPRLGLAAATGALAGLAYLTRFNVVIFLAPQVAVLLWRRRWRETLALAASAAVVAAPILAYNVLHFGRPLVGIYSSWNLLDEIGAYQVEPWLYYRVPDLGAELRGHLTGVAMKFVRNLTVIVPGRVWSLWHLDLILPLAIVAQIVKTGPNGRRFLAWSAALFVFQLILFSGLRLELEDRLSPHHGRYFFWFAVPAILLGVGLLKRLAEISRWWQVLSVAVIVFELALFARTWSGWIAQNEHVVLNLGHDPIRQAVSEMVSRDQVIASNQPQVTDWFCLRKSVSLPANPDELARLNRISPTPIDYVLIDLNYNAIALDRRWSAIVNNQTGMPALWEPLLLRDYQFVFPPELTRPVRYVLLRRRSVPPSLMERNVARGMLSPEAGNRP